MKFVHKNREQTKWTYQFKKMKYRNVKKRKNALHYEKKLVIYDI